MGFMIMSASAAELHEKYYSGIPQDVYEALICADPTFKGMLDTGDADMSKPMGSYGKQILKWAKDNGLEGVPLNRTWGSLYTMLRHYTEVLPNLPVEYRSITKFPTYQSFLEFYHHQMGNLIDQAAAATYATQVKVLHEDGEWLVIAPETFKASSFYGKGSKWCTATGEDANWFNQYLKQGKLVMCLNKDDKKYSYQLFAPDPQRTRKEFRYELKDWSDYDISFLALPNSLQDILTTLHLSVDDFTTEYQAVMTAELGSSNERFLDLYISTNIYAFDFHEERWVRVDETAGYHLRVGVFNYFQWKASDLVLLTADLCDLSKPGIEIRGVCYLSDGLNLAAQYKCELNADEVLSELDTVLQQVRHSRGAAAPYIVFTDADDAASIPGSLFGQIRDLAYAVAGLDVDSASTTAGWVMDYTETPMRFRLAAAPDAGTYADSVKDPDFKAWVSK